MAATFAKGLSRGLRAPVRRRARPDPRDRALQVEQRDAGIVLHRQADVAVAGERHGAGVDPRGLKVANERVAQRVEVDYPFALVVSAR